jgi:hypothetical protein
MATTTIADLENERNAWWHELARAAEAFVAARTRGDPTDEYARRMRRAERESRRIERRIRRRKRQAG